jgi:hypothetical protein
MQYGKAKSDGAVLTRDEFPRFPEAKEEYDMMTKAKKFKPLITRVKLNPEQAVLLLHHRWERPDQSQEPMCHESKFNLQ